VLRLPPSVAERLAFRDSRIAYVEADAPVHAIATQTPVTWGLDRIDQRSATLDNSFTYNATGAGVTAYIIDTGIRFSHSEFGGRAVAGVDVMGVDGTDCNGHGTHVAGTVGGATYGVAKAVKLVSVRVLGCDGSGTVAGAIAGIDWVTGHHQAGAPAVANMSLGASASPSLDNAVANSIADGVTYAIAAGNGNAFGFGINACDTSPARVVAALTIGATDRTDRKATWSNFGMCVDWFAPGVSITSGWSSGDSAVNTISGTSMAAPHTAGAAALYLQANPGATPAALRTALFNLTTKGVVTSSSTTNNHLLFAGGGAPPPPPTYACSNNLDDDGDGKVDYPADPGCTGATDTNETDAPPPPPPPACSNGADDDGDGKVDYPADPGCTSSNDTDEFDASVPPTTVSAFPSALTINTGALQSGGVSSLAADDGVYLHVNSSFATVRWSGRIVGVPNTLKSLKVTYRGLNSSTCTQTIWIWNSRTSTYESLGSRSVGVTEVETTASPTGVLADYVSGAAGNGDVDVRVGCSGSSFFTSFLSSAELLKVSYAP
jgi:subtilase family protein